MPLTDTEMPFPGALYAGDGSRLAGEGPNLFVPEFSDKFPFRVVICHPDAVPEQSTLELADRVWVLPDHFASPEGPPNLLLCCLADVIRSGRKVGLAAADELMCTHVRDLLVLAAVEADGQA